MNALFIASAASALGDATRVEVYGLADGNMSVGNIAETLGVSPSTVSYHLRLLEAAGLVVGARQGRRNCPRRRAERVWKLARDVCRFAV